MNDGIATEGSSRTGTSSPAGEEQYAVGRIRQCERGSPVATVRRTAKKAAPERGVPNGRRGTSADPDATAKVTRRRRGEPRRLLLEAAHELFTSQGFSGTSTREIAELAGVSETLMFRYFGSKVGLFREALVAPFVEFVEDFNAKWQSGKT